MSAIESSFGDADQALWYLREAMITDGLLQEEAELLVCAGINRCHKGVVGDLLRLMRRPLASHREIRVRYEPNDPYSLIVRITFPGVAKDRKARTRGGGSRVAILLKRKHGADVLLGSPKIVPSTKRFGMLPDDEEALQARRGAALSPSA